MKALKSFLIDLVLIAMELPLLIAFWTGIGAMMPGSGILARLGVGLVFWFGWSASKAFQEIKNDKERAAQ